MAIMGPSPCYVCAKQANVMRNRVPFCRGCAPPVKPAPPPPPSYRAKTLEMERPAAAHCICIRSRANCEGDTDGYCKTHSCTALGCWCDLG